MVASQEIFQSTVPKTRALAFGLREVLEVSGQNLGVSESLGGVFWRRLERLFVSFLVSFRSILHTRVGQTV
jgi:hypothetical protein